jgi:ABC-type antimicrobial peptide transport system permease subunit
LRIGAMLANCAAAISKDGASPSSKTRQRRAVGIRLCLGASKPRVIGAALADSAMLAVVGGLGGAAWVAAIRHVGEVGRLLPAGGTGAAILVAAAVVSLLVLLGGLVPAWRVAQLQPSRVLHDG